MSKSASGKSHKKKGGKDSTESPNTRRWKNKICSQRSRDKIPQDLDLVHMNDWVGHDLGSDVDDGHRGGNSRRNAKPSSPGTFPLEIPRLRELAAHTFERIVGTPSSQHGRKGQKRPDLAILHRPSSSE